MSAALIALRNRLVRAGDALSQLGNVLIFDGDPNHSISGDAHRFGRRRLAAAIDRLFARWDPDHCRASHQHDVEKALALAREAGYLVARPDQAEMMARQVLAGRGYAVLPEVGHE